MSLCLTKYHTIKTYPYLSTHRVMKAYVEWRHSSKHSELRLLYPRKKRSRYPLDGRIGVLYSRSGYDGEEKTLPCRDSNPGRPTYNLIAILTELFRFQADIIFTSGETFVRNSFL
jgi:hypothetical protein